MATTLTRGANVIAPTLVDGYMSTMEAATVVHQIIGKSEPDVTLRPSLMRSGTLRMAWLTTGAETDSAQAATWLQGTGPWVLASSEASSINMSFVVSGRIDRELDPDSRQWWTVSVDFQEVAP